MTKKEQIAQALNSVLAFVKGQKPNYPNSKSILIVIDDLTEAITALRGLRETSMKYPKKVKMGFTDEPQSRQVNVHMGRKFDYWFVQPNKDPYVIDSGSTPPQMRGVEIDFK